jgi:hypothetical protein
MFDELETDNMGVPVGLLFFGFLAGVYALGVLIA